MGKLFDLPKVVRWTVYTVIVALLVLFAIESRGEDLYFDAGSAIIRGETPTIGFNIVWHEKGPLRTDYELGMNMIGDSEFRGHNSNQFVVHGMLVDGYKQFNLGLGLAYFNVPSNYNCQFSTSLLARWRFNDHWHIQHHHFSSGGSCKPNVGRDLLTVGYKF